MMSVTVEVLPSVECEVPSLVEVPRETVGFLIKMPQLSCWHHRHGYNDGYRQVQ